jgi:molybdopterin molybdotransferase
MSAEKLLDVSEAREMVLQAARPLPAQKVQRHEALGRVVSHAPVAQLNVPQFDNSAMDGFAVRVADTAKATGKNPARLTVVAGTRAGDGPAARLKKGEAVRIMTGAPVPEGADGVIKQEDTCLEGEVVNILRPVEKGENIRREGEVVRYGKEALRIGTTIGPAAIGWLCECGIEEVSIHAVPKVGLITTGDEVVPRPEDLGPGKIIDSNLPSLRAALTQNGYALKWHCHVPDEKEQLTATIRGSMEVVDILMLTGGVSVGTHDFVREVLEGLGVSILFHGVRQKPGKPLLVGQKDHRLVFGLPGNPASALVGFYAYVLPALRKFSGREECAEFRHFAPLACDYEKRDGRTHLVRCSMEYLEGQWQVRPLKGQGSHMLKSFSAASALAVVEAGPGTVSAGTVVPIVPIKEECAL